MAYKASDRAQARALYVEERYTMPVISAHLRIGIQTLYRWKKEAHGNGDDWEVARNAGVLAAEGQEAVAARSLEDFTKMFMVVMEDLKGSSTSTPVEKAQILAALGDAYSKVVKSTTRTAPKLSALSIALDVLKDFAEFTTAYYPNHGPAFLEVLEPFGHHLTKKYAQK